MIGPLFKYVLMAALRDRLLISIATILVAVSSLCIFFAASVITEQDQFAQTFAAYGLRLFGVAALGIFIVNHVRRSFESRDIDYLLSRPVGRTGFVLTYAAAFAFLAIVAALILSLGVIAFAPLHLHAGIFAWIAGFCAEMVVVSAVSMFFALVLTSQTVCILAVLAFYLLSRLIGEILGILGHGAESGTMALLAKAMTVISIVVPRFDMLGRSDWILYGFTFDRTYAFIAGQLFVFFALIISAAVIDMKRRQF